MTYTFPNTEEAFRELARTITPDVVLYLPADFHERVPIVQVQELPVSGGPEDFLRSGQVQVDVYATGRTAARAIANDLRAVLLGPHGTDAGLLDDVYPVTEPHEVPYSHATVSLYSATYGVDTRPTF